MSPQPKPGEGRTNKRRRELARAKEDRQAARRASRDSVRRRRLVILGSVTALALAVITVGILLWPDSSTETPAAANSPVATPSAPPSATGAVVAGCKQAPTPSGAAKTYAKAPEQQLEPNTEYTLTLATNCGRIIIATLPKKAPQTVNSMLWLAQEGYFNNTLCHRLTTSGIYVLQCGDPQGTGSGGPGYQLPDENLPKEGAKNYPAGTVAMANAGPGTSGSQFFIVYQDTELPAGYTIWGRVLKGLDIVKEVAAAGVVGGGTDGAPNQPIGIIRATPKPALSQ